MKRILVLLLCLFLLGGCSLEKSIAPPIPDLNFSGNISVTYNNYEIECIIDNKIASECVLTVTKPELLSGLTMTVKDSDCTLKLGSIEYKIDSETLKQTQFASSLAEAFKNVLSTTTYEKLENGNWQYTGQTSVGKFTLVQDSLSGYPITLRIPDADLYVKFSNMKKTEV